MSPHAKITVDGFAFQGRVPPLNMFFGCDEPNYAYYPHGSDLLSKLGDMGKQNNQQVFFRTHNLLSTGPEGLAGVPGLKWGSTNVYSEDEDGNPSYDFTIFDRIIDTYLSKGIKPYLQLGFMPLALAKDPDPYFFKFNPTDDPLTIFKGWTHPPKSYEKWEELIFQLVSHCVERYGKAECESWWYETWNEPDQPYWSGTQEEFFRLHDHTIHAIRRVLPGARVGGADLAVSTGGEEWLKAFIDHCLHGDNYATGKSGTPLDFVSFHSKGQPGVKDGHVQMDMSVQLKNIDAAMTVVRRFPSLIGVTVLLGEYDPDSCAAYKGQGYGYRNSLIYGAYTAASFVKALDLARERTVNLHGLTTWAFEFEASKIDPEENEIFAGFRTLSTQGIDQSVLNVHRMMAMMCGGERIKAKSTMEVSALQVMEEGVRKAPDVGAMASVKGDQVCVLVWHYHDDEVELPDAKISMDIKLPRGWNDEQIQLLHFRVDEKHSDAYSVWKAMGSPQPPSKKQYAKLQEASRLALAEKPREVDGRNGTVSVEFELPVRGVSLLRLSK